MSRDYSPNHAIWGLVNGALEDVDEHVEADDIEVQKVGTFETMVRVKGTWSGVAGVRRFRIKLSEVDFRK